MFLGGGGSVFTLVGSFVRGCLRPWARFAKRLRKESRVNRESARGIEFMVVRFCGRAGKIDSILHIDFDFQEFNCVHLICFKLLDVRVVCC